MPPTRNGARAVYNKWCTTSLMLVPCSVPPQDPRASRSRPRYPPLAGVPGCLRLSPHSLLARIKRTATTNSHTLVVVVTGWIWYQVFCYFSRLQQRVKQWSQNSRLHVMDETRQEIFRFWSYYQGKQTSYFSLQNGNKLSSWGWQSFFPWKLVSSWILKIIRIKWL